MQPLDGEQLPRNRADMFLVSRVDLIAPLPRPLIQILPTGEGASRQKVGLDEPERSLHAHRTIRIPNRVRHKLKAETLCKCGHLRHRHHVASAAAQHHHVRVIDHGETCHADPPRRAQNHSDPPALAARSRFRAAGRTPLTRYTTTPRRPPPTPHGLARDSPCTGRKAPGSVAGKARPSRFGAVPVVRSSWSAGLCVPPRGRFPAPARSPVCSLAGHSVPESWYVALGSTCGSFSGRISSSMRRSWL